MHRKKEGEERGCIQGMHWEGNTLPVAQRDKNISIPSCYAIHFWSVSGLKSHTGESIYVLSSLLFLETQICHCKIYLLLKSATESHMERMIIEAGSSRCIDWQRTAGRLISAVWIKTAPNLRTEEEGTSLPHTERETQSRQKEGRETHTNLTLPELHSPDVRLVDLIQLHQFVYISSLISTQNTWITAHWGACKFFATCMQK